MNIPLLELVTLGGGLVHASIKVLGLLGALGEFLAESDVVLLLCGLERLAL
jgi:hypothetical protein